MRAIARLFAVLAPLALAAAPAAARFEDLAGSWVNVDSASKGVVKLEVGGTAREPTVQLFGACTPNPCDWGEVSGVSFATAAADDLGAKTESILAFYETDTARRTVVLKRRDDGQLRAEIYSEFTDGSNRANYQTIATLQRAPEEPVGLGPEDCVAFKANQVQVQQKSGKSRIVAGSTVLVDFGSNHLEAVQAVVVFLTYGLNQQCFVGRPEQPTTYYLKSGTAPAGASPGEKCTAFDPENIAVQKKSGRWKLVDGSAQLLDFNTRLDLAERMAEVIQHYAFTRVCTLGGSPPAMTYFRQ
jgi:hypothetical protein